MSTIECTIYDLQSIIEALPFLPPTTIKILHIYEPIGSLTLSAHGKLLHVNIYFLIICNDRKQQN